MERLGREMDLISRFLNVKNGAREVVAMVEKLWGRISRSKPSDENGVLLNDEWRVAGPGAWQIHVPRPKEQGICEDGVAEVVAWHGGYHC